MGPFSSSERYFTCDYVQYMKNTKRRDRKKERNKRKSIHNFIKGYGTLPKFRIPMSSYETFFYDQL
jgi:hypothetical protein